MIIDSSSIRFASQHTLFQQSVRSERVKAWVGNQEPTGEGRNFVVVGGFNPEQFTSKIQRLGSSLQGKTGGTDALNGLLDSPVKVNLSQKARHGVGVKNAVDAVDLLKKLEEMQYEILSKIIEKYTGKKFDPKMFRLSDGESFDEAFACMSQQSSSFLADFSRAIGGGSGGGGEGQQARVGWGIEAELSETNYESEQMEFSASGLIKTQDGKEIVFSVDMSMSREFLQENNLSIRMGDATLKDPLVVNFGGNAAQLTDDKYSFDIDADGKVDTMSFVSSGSGFLTLDKNGDGKVTDGSELFGAKTGEGFKELAAYDADKNGWIDEADPIYKQLQLWSRDGAGNEAISSLAQKGVGAIYLGAAATPFQLKSLEDNSLQGAIRSSGIYLGENGQVGTVQQIDLAV